MVARSVETPFAYLELSIQERVNEASLPRMFELVKKEILSNRPAKVLVDMREASVELTISDKLGLVKMVIGAFVGIVDCFAIVLRPVDILPEKFFEPAVTSRGLPAYVTTEIEDAIYWLGQKRKSAR